MLGHSFWAVICLVPKTEDIQQNGKASGEIILRITLQFLCFLTMSVPQSRWKVARLFEGVSDLKLEPIEVSGTSVVTHIRYKVISSKD